MFAIMYSKHCHAVCLNLQVRTKPVSSAYCGAEEAWCTVAPKAEEGGQHLLRLCLMPFI